MTFARPLVAALFILTVGLAATPPAVAQDAGTAARNAALKEDPDLMQLHLMDGSVLTGKMSFESITVKTAYGDLIVPIKAIQRITPGMHSHPELRARVNKLIEQLGSDVFDERETAQRQLADLGPAIRQMLEKRANDDDNERRTRIEKILEEFDTLADDMMLSDDVNTTIIPEEDAVETPKFTIVGQITPDAFKLDSAYGTLTVKFTDVRQIMRANVKEENIRRTVTVSGGDIAQKKFKATPIRVSRGDRVVINASGKITMTPWGTNAITTPDGATNYGWYVNNEIAVGALVGKIGNGGDIFLIGSDKSFVADRDGVLMMAVGMNPSYANQVMPGEYKVRVHVRKK